MREGRGRAGFNADAGTGGGSQSAGNSKALLGTSDPMNLTSNPTYVSQQHGSSAESFDFNSHKVNSYVQNQYPLPPLREGQSSMPMSTQGLAMRIPQVECKCCTKPLLPNRRGNLEVCGECFWLMEEDIVKLQHGLYLIECKECSGQFRIK